MKWTIQSLLTWTEDYLKKQGLEKPRIDAEILLSHVLKKRRVDLYVQFETPVSASELAAFKPLIQRRSKHEPLQYITGKQEFWSLDFHVTSGILIPRQETECLIEKVLEIFGDRKEEALRILDIGCGSGVIGIVLAKEFPKADVVAIDISDKALDSAKKNAKAHAVVDRISFIKSDFFTELKPDEPYDLIVSNPPYLREDERESLASQVKDYEPSEALFSGVDGMNAHRKIIQRASSFLNPQGHLFMEIAPDQANPLNECLTNAKNFSNIEVSQDYERRERIIAAQYAPQ